MSKFNRQRLTEAEKKDFLEKYNRGDYTKEQLLFEFKIQPGTYRQWTKIINDGKDFLNCKPCGRPTVMTQPIINFISRSLGQVSKQTLKELKQKIKDKLDVEIGKETIRTYLHKQGLAPTFVDACPSSPNSTAQIVNSSLR
ncbi:Trp_repressor/replication initiator [Hexamita inflata]|uniref:Trp repressor/replication initiator n=1 Tax=Hexamita inflata TaxID=28002 RepID=A0AA86PAX1_9EUKA|nr:Trp repressor/replication initiator [Hexamita inflata]